MEQKGFTAWFTGLPCAGKTVVADRVAELLTDKGLKIERLDGDIVRESLTKDLGFTKEDRDTNIRRVSFVAKLLSRNEVGVLSSFISPYREVRQEVREKTTNFVEIFVNPPLEVCKERDVKNMYAQAERGEIENFTGISDPYEEPENPEVELRTDKEEVDESAKKVIDKLVELDYIPDLDYMPGIGVAEEDEEEGEDVYSEEEEEELKERLKNLGYL